MFTKMNFYKKPAIILIAGFSFLAQAKSIKDLTSTKASKKVENQVAEVAKMTGTATKVHMLGVGLGQTFLKGDFADLGEDKITAEIFYDYSASHSFDFMANIHYSKHEYRNYEAIISGVAVGIKAKLYNFDAFAPFASGGLGFYSPKVTREVNGELKESESKVTFGYHLGGGADLDLNKKVKVGMIGMIHNPFDVKQDYQPKVEGSYFKLLMTAYYKF
jgi:opacity protein-like surface antigen